MLATLGDEDAHVQPWGAAKGLIGTTAALGLLFPLHLLTRRLEKPHLPQVFHRLLSRALGVRTIVHGAPARDGGVLFVANHLSWADIPVIGARLPGCFVARSDVADWGLFGWLAAQQRTIYVERERRQAAAAQQAAIGARLARGDNVILFPEGTTSNGLQVLPFKSSLFAVADEEPERLIQPVSIAYTQLNGLPVTRAALPKLAWTGDMELMPHVLDFMRLGRVRAEIRLHPPVRRTDFPDRKALARHCQQVVAAGYAALMRQAAC